MVFQNDILAGASGAGGYQIDQSVWFDGSTGWLNRTMATGTDAKTFSFSVWFKQTTPNNALNMQILFGAFPSEAFSVGTLGVSGSNQLSYRDNNSGSPNVSSAGQYRDPGAWMHLLFVVNTTEATPSNRVKIYTNGTLTTNSSVTYPSLNETGTISTAVNHEIGRRSTNYWLRSYVAEMYFIDGQALAPTDFGEYNADGVWIPKAYVGTYGINGFYLDFANAGALGTDVSGNGNNWTVNGTITQVTDSPTDNYATWSAIQINAGTLANGSLKITALNSKTAVSTFRMDSGKWIASAKSSAGSSQAIFGLWQDMGTVPPASDPGFNVNSWAWYIAATAGNRGVWTNSAKLFTVATLDNTYDMLVAVDIDAGKMWFGTDIGGTTVWYNSAGGTTGDPATGANPTATFTAGSPMYFAGQANANTITANFGQSSFAYTAPTGFKFLSTANLPEPAIKDGSKYFDANTRTGTGAAFSVTGIGFQPDFVWTKGRSGATDHALFDSVRGVQKDLAINTGTAEVTDTQGLSAFNSDGFSGGSLAKFNTSAATYVDWMWKIGATPGLDIVTYTGNNTARTISHALGAVPAMMLIKNRSTTNGMLAYHKDMIASPQGYYMTPTSTGAPASLTTWLNNTAPTSSVFSVGADVNSNGNTNSIVAFLFAEVENFSKLGKYTGNGSADGPFVWCGFKPAYVLVKRTNAVSQWSIFDNQREGYNVDNDVLVANTTAAETTTDYIDLLSNGFKARTTDANVNASGGTYIYMAFAEHPFGGDGVAPATAR